MKFIDTHIIDQPIPLASRGSMPEQVHVFDRDSIHAVNAALAARRPLLVRGEPGTGKSQLARAAAKALERAYVQCVVDSRTESRDLLWEFDAVTRLAEAQLRGALGEEREQVRDRLNEANFVRPGPLWWCFDWQDALDQAQRVGEAEPEQADSGDPANGSVLLVDEIDKAESDVPNGLLEALGSGQFTPQGRTHPVTAHDVSPLVVITTNEERALPDAFVRRCLVLFLSVPDTREELINMLVRRGRAHFGENVDDRVLGQAAEMLADDRAEARKDQRPPYPGQAEYLDLVRAVLAIAPDDLDKQCEILENIRRFALKKHQASPS